MKNNKTLQNIEDVIDIILYDSIEEKTKYQRHFFKVAETGALLKQFGLKGDIITVKYGVITHHHSKDIDHILSSDDWLQISKKINQPLVIAEHEGGGRLLLNIERKGKYIIIGIDIKNAGKNTFINAIVTAFYKDSLKDKILYVDKKITAEKQALLGGPNSHQYLAISGSNLNILPLEKSVNKKNNFEASHDS